MFLLFAEVPSVEGAEGEIGALKADVDPNLGNVTLPEVSGGTKKPRRSFGFPKNLFRRSSSTKLEVSCRV